MHARDPELVELAGEVASQGVVIELAAGCGSVGVAVGSKSTRAWRLAVLASRLKIERGTAAALSTAMVLQGSRAANTA